MQKHTYSKERQIKGHQMRQDSSLAKRLTGFLVMFILLVLPFSAFSLLALSTGYYTKFFYLDQFEKKKKVVQAEILDYSEYDSCRSGGNQSCDTTYFIQFTFNHPQHGKITRKLSTGIQSWSELQRQKAGTVPVEYATVVYPDHLYMVSDILGLGFQKDEISMRFEWQEAEERIFPYVCFGVGFIIGLVSLWMLAYALRLLLDRKYYEQQLREQSMN